MSARPTADFKKEFPIFARRQSFVYLDSAATALKPQRVLDAYTRFFTDIGGSVHRGLYGASAEADTAYAAARDTVRAFIGANAPEEIVFTKNTTESLNLVAETFGAERVKKGDRIIVSALEHHSNLLPWRRLARRAGAELVIVPCQPDGSFAPSVWERAVTKRTRIVAITAMSNVLGTLPPVADIAALAHAAGAVVVVDAAQAAAHMPLSVHDLGCDFLAFSGHKVYGPTGIGVLYGRAELLAEMPPFLLGGGMVLSAAEENEQWAAAPERFEAGTPPIAEAVALGEAIRFIQSIGFPAIEKRERALHTTLREILIRTPGVTVYGPTNADASRAVVSFNIEGVHPHDVASLLDEKGVAIRAGRHCAEPLLAQLSLLPRGTCRASLGLYNTESDIAVLENGLDYVRKTFTR